MIQRNVIEIATVFALLTATACGDDDPKDPGNDQDAATLDSGRPDGGDAATSTDAKVDGAVRDGGDLDASKDAAPTDAQADAVTDANTVADVGTDAAQDDAGADAGTDAGTDAGMSTLAAWYKFDENTGTSAADSTSHFAASTLQNGAAWVAGKSGSAVNLTGGLASAANPYVSLPADLLADCDDVTVALWLKLGAVTNWSRILDLDGKVNGFLYLTAAQDVGGTPHLLFNIYKPDYPMGDPRNDQRVSAEYPSGTTLAGQWHHVAFTLAEGVGHLYFDGAQIGMNEMTTKPSDLQIAQNGEAVLGRSLIFQDPYLNGTIDDLRVSCTAYSAQQIAALAE
jgi:hypothetical protein